MEQSLCICQHDVVEGTLKISGEWTQKVILQLFSHMVKDKIRYLRHVIQNINFRCIKYLKQKQNLEVFGRTKHNKDIRVGKNFFQKDTNVQIMKDKINVICHLRSPGVH